MQYNTITLSAKSSQIMPFIALCLGFFMVIIDVTIVNVALPSLAVGLKANMSGLQWIMDGYTLTFAGLLLSAGFLSDRVDAKSACLWGLIVFVAASIGCGLANSLSVLIICRLLQGIGAAVIVPSSLKLIHSLYENQEERARAIGLWASVSGIAAASGPIMGALLISWLGWRAVFFVNVPIGIIGILFAIKYVLKKRPVNRDGNFDILGQLLGITSIGSLAFGLIEAGKLGWLSEKVVGGFCVFLVTFTAFLITERRAKSPMFPLHFFKSKTFSVSIAVGMIINLGFYGELFIFPLYFQQLREYSVLMTGLAILPMPAFVVIASYLGGKLASIRGPKIAMMIGLIIGAIGFLTSLIVKEHGPSYFALIVPLSAIGFGTAFTMPAATIAAIHSVPQGNAGIASGALNTSRQIGSLMGVAIFGTIVTSSTDFISGMHVTLIVSGLIFLIGCLAVYRF